MNTNQTINLHILIKNTELDIKNIVEKYFLNDNLTYFYTDSKYFAYYFEIPKYYYNEIVEFLDELRPLLRYKTEEPNEDNTIYRVYINKRNIKIITSRATKRISIS